MDWLPFSDLSINSFVPPGQIGVYTLRRGTGTEAKFYVGRAEDLKRRLKDHLVEDYDVFNLIICDSLEEAALIECIRFHDFKLLVGGKFLNKNHPNLFRDSRCPVLGCKFR